MNTLGNIKNCVVCQAPRTTPASSTPPSHPAGGPPMTQPSYPTHPAGGPPIGGGQPAQPQWPGYQPQPTPGQPQPYPPQHMTPQPTPVGYPPYAQPPQPTPPQPIPTPVASPPAVTPSGMIPMMSPDGRVMTLPAPPGHPQHVPHVYASYAAMMGYPQAQPPTPTPLQPTPVPTPTPVVAPPQPTYNPYASPAPNAGGYPAGIAVTSGPISSPPVGAGGAPTPGAGGYMMDPSLLSAFAPVPGGQPMTSPPSSQPVASPTPSYGMSSPVITQNVAPIMGEFGVENKRIGANGTPSPAASGTPFVSLEGMGLPASHAAMNRTSPPAATAGPSSSPSSSAANAFAGLAASALRDISAQGPPITLTPEQKKQFVRQGYVVIPGVVSQQKVTAALRAINQDMGRGVSREDAAKAKSTTWCPSLMPMPVITNLFNATNAIQLVSSVLGQPCPAVTAGQIALRHPGTLCTDPVTFTPVPWWDKGWHIDGFHSKDNGIPKGQIRNFTCLVGVLLNDLPSEMCGNLAVFPRSHILLQDYFRTHGFDKVKDGLDSFPRLPLSKPVQITGNAGDVVICHYQLAHTIAPNVSPNIRYACYFRVTAPTMKTQTLPPVPDALKDGADPHRPESMLNIWKDWPGVTPYVDPNEGEREGAIEWKDGGEGPRPFYGDEVARVEDEKAAEDDRRRAVVQEQADKLFEAHKWLECQPIWTQLATEQPHDYVIQFKAGCVHTWSPREDTETLRQGEEFLTKAAALCPVYPNVYAVLAHNRLRQGRHKEAVEAVKQMLRCPYKEGEDRTIVDALKHARDSLVKLDQVTQLDGMLKQARTSYPHLGSQFDEIMVGVEGEQTWVQCKAWLDSPSKSFPHGEALFRKLVSLKPTDYWANWLLGGVLTWEGKREKCIQGQPFIAEALTINPSLPHGYQLMAQNLMIQGKPQEAVAQVQAMLAQPLEDIATNDGHAQKIIEALNTVFKVLGKSSPEFQSLLTTAQSSYPSLLPRLAQFQ
jgi:tetratricopeptide (TPR) repeat protein